MRFVAEICGVALGSLYNYFPSKEALILATIESVWEDIFHMENFFTAHSLSFTSGEKDKAKNTMEHYFSHIKMGMMEALNSDSSVRQDAFSEYFLKSDFLDFVLTNLLACLVQKKNDCAMLLKLIQRAIYID